jgi:hypothetical protein
MTTNQPIGRTLFGVTAWRVPGHWGQHLTWGGPGDSLHLRVKAGTWAEQPGYDQLGDDAGDVTGPLATVTDAQAAVDSYQCSRCADARLATARE